MKKQCNYGWQLGFAKRMSKISAKGMVIIACVFAVLMIVCTLCPGKAVAMFISDMLSPVSMRSLAYNIGDGYRLFSPVAYMLGVILLSGVLVPVVTNYLRNMGERYISGTLSRYHWRGHTLFLGYDDLMLQTLREALGTGGSVVVAVPDHVAEVRSRIGNFLSGNGSAVVEVVRCNMCDGMELKKRACVKDAATVFLIGQSDDPTHDATNFKSLDVLSGIIDSGSRPAEALPKVFFYVRNGASFSLIQRQGYVRENNSRLHQRVHPFNFYENIAANLLTGIDRKAELMRPDYHNGRKNLALRPDADVHLVILGMTEMGMALAREVLMVAHYPGHRVRLTLVDENAREGMFFFIGRYKELFKLCRYSFQDLDGKETAPEQAPIGEELIDVSFDFIKGGVAHPELMRRLEAWAEDEKQLLTLAICTNDSPQNMAAALYLPRILIEGDKAVPVWVYQQGDDSLKEFMSHDFYKSLHTFSPSEYGCLPLNGSAGVDLAIEVDKAYKQSSKKEGGGKSWEEMAQYERWSSLYNARSIIAKLQGLGYELRMDDEDGRKMRVSCFLTEPPTDSPSLELTDIQIRDLSRTEHIRWIVDTLTKGFRPTTEEEHARVMSDKKYKNYLKQTLFAHDDIRPFDNLSSETAQYDIDMTLAILNAINAKLK